MNATKMKTKSLWMAVAAVLVATSTMAGQPERKSKQVFDEIAERLNTYIHYTIFDHVTVELDRLDRGIVTLTGQVTMGYKRSEIERRVAQVEGVDEVRNEISLLPASQSDDDLRARLARQIYGDVRFRQYSPVNAPIHIVVENARVTLKGVVTDPVEQALARSLIADTPGVVSVTSELKTEAEARAERASTS